MESILTLIILQTFLKFSVPGKCKVRKFTIKYGTVPDPKNSREGQKRMRMAVQ